MKIPPNNANPYGPQMGRPGELLAEAQKAAQRRGSSVAPKAGPGEAQLQKPPERDPQSAKYKAEAARRDLERRPQFPSQFIDKTI